MMFCNKLRHDICRTAGLENEKYSQITENLYTRLSNTPANITAAHFSEKP